MVASGLIRLARLRAVCAGGLVSAVLCVVATCTPVPDSPAEWTLEGGQTLAEAFGDQSATVVLILDPSQCFTCANLLSQWLDWRTENPDAFRLVMSRLPEPWERPKLAPLPVDGTLIVPVESRQLPLEVILADGGIEYRSPVLRGVSDSELLLALRGGDLTAALAGLNSETKPHTLSKEEILP